MAGSWIDTVMQTNEHIVEAEDRMNMQVATLFTMFTEGQDTTEGERLLVAYVDSLVLLRAIQSQQLEAVGQ